MFRIQLFRLFQTVGLVLFNVKDGEFKQFLLITALRDGKDNVFKLHVQLKGHDDFAGKALVPFAHLDNAQ